MSRRPAVSIAGVRVDAVDRHDAASRIVAATEERRHLAVHLCNAYVLALAADDPGYAALLDRGDLNLADGAPVAWYARRAGLRASARPSGGELFEEVARLGLARDVRHYLYGASPEVVERLADRLRERFRGITVVAADAPPFGPVTEDEVAALADRLAETDANLLWVGLGTPRQDDVVDRLHGRFAGAVVPVGAVFDFLAGAKPRAPRWLRRLGLEWLHRLATEPRRLWRRYLWGNLRFLWALVRTGKVVDRSGSAEP